MKEEIILPLFITTYITLTFIGIALTLIEDGIYFIIPLTLLVLFPLIIVFLGCDYDAR